MDIRCVVHKETIGVILLNGQPYCGICAQKFFDKQQAFTRKIMKELEDDPDE